VATPTAPSSKVTHAWFLGGASRGEHQPGMSRRAHAAVKSGGTGRNLLSDSIGRRVCRGWDRRKAYPPGPPPTFMPSRRKPNGIASGRTGQKRPLPVTSVCRLPGSRSSVSRFNLVTPVPTHSFSLTKLYLIYRRFTTVQPSSVARPEQIHKICSHFSSLPLQGLVTSRGTDEGELPPLTSLMCAYCLWTRSLQYFRMEWVCIFPI
jgi:hypothetical protein